MTTESQTTSLTTDPIALMLERAGFSYEEIGIFFNDSDLLEELRYLYELR